MMQRKKTLALIQNKKMMSNAKVMSLTSLPENNYSKILEIDLHLIGTKGNLPIIKQLRKSCYTSIQLGITILYALVVATTLISHDVFFEERALEYYLKDEQLADDGSVILQKVLLIAELILLVLFIIDMILHMMAYG